MSDEKAVDTITPARKPESQASAEVTPEKEEQHGGSKGKLAKGNAKGKAKGKGKSDKIKPKGKGKAKAKAAATAKSKEKKVLEMVVAYQSATMLARRICEEQAQEESGGRCLVWASFRRGGGV